MSGKEHGNVGLRIVQGVKSLEILHEPLVLLSYIGCSMHFSLTFMLIY